MTAQVDEELTIRVRGRQASGDLHGEGRLAAARHPVDQVNDGCRAYAGSTPADHPLYEGLPANEMSHRSG
nr:hypothetical protein [Verrucosispora sioxanthis]